MEHPEGAASVALVRRILVSLTQDRVGCAS
jgi:hypothetical protein